jgi:CubicO group peptidase (beta-lactamase class C family)
MRKLPREAPPGTKWVYKTSETNLVGVLVMEATQKPLADYLSEKIWRPYGMERDAEWMIDDIGHEQGGCCLAMTLRDLGRFGDFILDEARIGGVPIVPDTWLAEATRNQIAAISPGQLRLPVVTARRRHVRGPGIYGQTLHRSEAAPGDSDRQRGCAAHGWHDRPGPPEFHRGRQGRNRPGKVTGVRLSRMADDSRLKSGTSWRWSASRRRMPRPASCSSR